MGPSSTDIAIVGYAFRLPQDVNDDASFWEALEQGRNLSTESPSSRIDVSSFVSNDDHKYVAHGGHYINEEAGAFDAPFFSITAKEARSMDPMHRWTLENSYQAFENAGMPVEALRGSRTSVFSASMMEDFSKLMAADPDDIERMAATGSAVASMMANRVSWYFDLRGPSIHVNTACSSGMSALDMACKSINSGDSSCALITGANLLLDPSGFQMLSDQNFLSPDSKCYSFDHRANGYARGEGIIALVLKPVSDAIREGNMIRAVIRATGSNQDGKTPVLTQPSSESQQDLIRHVYKQAGLDMAKTRYVEAHGTGTPVGDPIEMNAIGKVFQEHRSGAEPLYVSSVKANLGHLEGASGLASIVKCILILERGVIPPAALFERINPAIDAESLHIDVPTQSVPWPSSGLRRISVNSFGYGGSNAHVCLDDALHYLQERGLKGFHCTAIQPQVQSNGEARLTNGPNGTTEPETVPMDYVTTANTALPKLLVWSAADAKAAARIADSYQAFYRTQVSGHPAQLDKLALTLGGRRSRMAWRSFATMPSGPDGITGPGHEELPISKPVKCAANATLAFVFTGQGAQYTEMGRDLVSFPVFRASLEKVDGAFRSVGCEWSILDALLGNIDEPQYSQPLTTAIQIALVDLLESFNIVPTAVVGHSSGEIAAAYAAGALSLDSAAKVAYLRGEVAGSLKRASAARPGAMLSINLPPEKVDDYVAEALEISSGTDVSVACINSPLNCTLSGPEISMDKINAKAEQDGIFARKLKTGVPYHSPFMKAVSSTYLELLTKLGKLDSRYPEIDKDRNTVAVVSSVTGDLIGHSELASAQYWVRNMIAPVQFADAVRNMAQDFPSTNLVEVGPHPALSRPVKDTFEKCDAIKQQLRYHPTLNRSQPAIQTILDLAGTLFCQGHNVDITAVNQQTSQEKTFLVNCPKYPFDHATKYWSEPRQSRSYRHRVKVSGDTLGVRVSDWNPLRPRWRKFLTADSTPWINQHVVSGTMLYPAAGMLIMAMEAAHEMIPKDRLVNGFSVAKAEILRPITVATNWESRVEVQLELRPVKRQQDGDRGPTLFDAAIFTHSSDSDVWTECFTGTVEVDCSDSDQKAETKDATKDSLNSFETAKSQCTRPVHSADFYHNISEQGIEYGEWFQTLKDARWDGRKTAIASVDVTNPGLSTTSLVHPTVLDACFQVLRLSEGQQAAANVPVRVENAWFSASGWQGPSTRRIEWCATADARTSPLDGGAGEKGSLFAVSDAGSVLCTVKKAVSSPVAQKLADDSNDSDGGKKLIYALETLPQLDLLPHDTLQRFCQVNTFVGIDPAIGDKFEQLDFALEAAIVRALDGLDETKVPSALAHHLAMLKHRADCLPDSQREQAMQLSDGDLATLLDESEERLPKWTLPTVVARALPQILHGEVDPLQVIFADSLADRFYSDLFYDICADGRLRRFLRLLSHENPDLRILEVGSGTGGVTGHVIGILQQLEAETGGRHFAEYHYTDISPSFFEHAAARWPELVAQGRIHFRTLDIGGDLMAQGFEPGSYDVVVAGSVLHATPDLEQTIRHVRGALKASGRLILPEAVGPGDLVTNFFGGLMPGWWVASEPWRQKQMTPIVSEESWDRCLRGNGFTGNDMVIRDHPHPKWQRMSIIFSQVAATEEEQLPKPHRRVFLVADSDQLAQSENFPRLLMDWLNSLPEIQVVTLSFSKDELRDKLANLQANDVVIMLVEAYRPLLSQLTGEDFENLKYLLDRTTNLLWVTSASKRNPQFPLYGAMPGFLRTIRAEQPHLRAVTLSIEEGPSWGPAESCTHASMVFQASFRPIRGAESRELEYTARDGVLQTTRAVRDVAGDEALGRGMSLQLRDVPWSEAGDCVLTLGTRGAFDTFRFRENEYSDNDVEDIADDKSMFFRGDVKRPLSDGELEIEAKVWGMTRNDVRKAQGTLDDGFGLGTDCAGIVTQVGRKCNGFKPGDRVWLMARGCMRKFPRAPITHAKKIPKSVTLDQATSFMLPISVAHHAMYTAAGPFAESVLILHAESTNGSMAAIVSEMLEPRNRNKSVFVQVSTPEQRTMLMEGHSVLESRVFDNHSDCLEALMDATKGKGVEMIVSMLPMDDEVWASCDALAEDGVIVDASQQDTDLEPAFTVPSRLIRRGFTLRSGNLEYFDPDPNFESGIISTLMGVPDMAKYPWDCAFDILLFNLLTKKRMFQDSMDGGSLFSHMRQAGAQQRRLPTIPAFNLAQVGDAFKQHQLDDGSGNDRFILKANAEDNVPYLARPYASWRFDANATYLVAGGFGGLGRAILEWMVEKGARFLLVLSRSGARSDAAADLVARLTDQGVQIAAPCCDAASETRVSEVLKDLPSHGFPPLKGVINAVAVLQDAFFRDMTAEQWAQAQQAKIGSSWNLHRLLPRNLDFFVMLTSLAGTLGQMGSANYASGATYQDALVAHRVATGQRATALDIGWMRDVGMIAENREYQSRRHMADDSNPIDGAELLALLDLVCNPANDTKSASFSKEMPTTRGDQVLLGLRTPADALAQGRPVPALQERPLFAYFAHDPNAGSSTGAARGADRRTTAELFRQAESEGDKAQVVQEALAGKLATAMSIGPEDVEPGKPLSAYGVDSLMAVDLMNWIRRDFGVRVAVFDIMGGAPIATVARRVVAKSGQGEE